MEAAEAGAGELASRFTAATQPWNSVSDARLRQLFEANVVGILIANDAGAIVDANDAFLDMIGYSRADLQSGAIGWRRLTPPEWLARDESAIAEMARLGKFAQFEKEYVRKDGTRLPISIGGTRIAGSDDHSICYIVDLSDVRRAEAAQREAMRRLEESEQRYRVLTEALPEIIMLTNDDRLPVYVNRRYEEYTGLSVAELPTKWRDVIHPDDLPNVDRIRATGRPYEIEYRLRRASDGAYRWHLARVLKVSQNLPGAGWLGAAMDIDDRKRAEEALAFIARAGSLLSQSLDLQMTFDTLLDLVVPDIGDWANIVLLGENDVPSTVAARHKDPAKSHLIERIRGADYLKASYREGTAAALRTGLPQLRSHVDRDYVRSAIREPYRAITEELGFGSFVILPIFVEEDVIGTIVIVSAGDRRRYTPADLPPLEELARRAGFAIGNARRYGREHRVASMLQDGALPRTLPDVEGFRFDGHYRAGRTDAAIGGDWFDALVLADGRIVVSVGDVAGSGLEAAVLMGNMRHVIRAAAQVAADPLVMFDVADRTLRSEGEDRMVTAFVGVIDPAAMTMVYASAGHPPALLCTGDGRVTELHAPGPPLGLRDLSDGGRSTIVLPPGSRLLLYTDGLIEWSRDVAAGEALLQQHFAEAPDPGDSHPAKSLIDAVLPKTGARDDVAALTVTVAQRSDG